jgi:5-methylcytosine-specific restriction enzyme subunit McrC
MSHISIPIQNIYYLLSYAWNKLEESKIVAVDPIECSSAVDLFAKVLVNGMTYIMRRGLDRGYVSHHEQTSRLRGRIDFSTTLRTTYFRHPSAFCDYDELSYDVLHNQIVRTTIARLLRIRDMDKDIKQELRLVEQRLRQVSLIPLAKKYFSLVQLHSNNYFYDFLLDVCELIHDNLMISEEEGTTKFRDFLRDDDAMGRLFEGFVRNFFKKEQSEYEVGVEIIHWRAKPLGETPLGLLPTMRTDVSLTSPKRKIIIDTKYYPQALQVYYDKESIHSDHLNQLHAYLSNVGSEQGEPKCEGILLYPTVEKELDWQWDIKGHKVCVRTINLNQDWKEIHQSLLNTIA